MLQMLLWYQSKREIYKTLMSKLNSVSLGKKDQLKELKEDLEEV
jgi:hypothetical protein